MTTPFTKMHGLGNDFVVFDGRKVPVALSARQVQRIADRRTGVGCDQLFVLEPSETADAFVRIWNADGGEVGACGNGMRAVGVLLGGLRRLDTAAGVIETDAADGGARVDMGMPMFDWEQIPLAYAMDTLAMPVGWGALSGPVAVSMGNPHVVFFVDDLDAVDLAAVGPGIEHDPIFPERVNVNVAQVLSRDHIRLKVWERGAGATLACGTGACATAVAAMRRGLTGRRVTVSLPGGDLGIEWTADGRVLMSGPAVVAFTGEIDLDRFA
jgi:diaminopimelate epimerase